MVVVHKFLRFRPESELEDEFAFNEDKLMSDVIDEIVRQVQTLSSSEAAQLEIHYDGYENNPQANFKIVTDSKELRDRIEEIVNTASPSS